MAVCPMRERLGVPCVSGALCSSGRCAAGCALCCALRCAAYGNGAVCVPVCPCALWLGVRMAALC
ncbi:hypothetical protein SEA_MKALIMITINIS3_144 [Mycobacterium phage MkaliMitinis3]|nr:hypothetical protein SEA_MKALIMITINIS3_144 [Mycobacterium phage MkaliMitinis3]